MLSKIYRLNLVPFNVGGLVLMFAAFALLLPGTGGMQILLQGDEYMHIATVRQSLLKGTYLLPSLEGVPNYFKPPVMFWLAMLSETLLGSALWIVRLPAVFAGVFTALGVYFFLKELKAPAFLPALFYLFSLGSLKFSRLLMMEQFLALSLLLCAFFLVRYQRVVQLRWMFLAGFVAGLAYFFKGPLFQIYASFLFLAWAIPRLFRFDSRDGHFRGLESIKEIMLAGLVFHLPLLLPLVWNLYLFYFEPSGLGRALLEFFFVNENIAKFAQKDQASGLILLGWFLYTFPWTLLIPGAIYLALRRLHVRTLRRQVGFQLLGVALAISLLHLLPHRKDPYYIMPAIPIFVVAISLFLSTGIRRLRPLIRANLIFIAGLIFVVAVALMILRAPVWSAGALLLISFFNLGIYLKLKNSPSRIFMQALLLGGGLAMVGLQFIAIPAIAQPKLPSIVQARISDSLCIISDESWDAFAFQALLPTTQVRHAIPAQATGCSSNANSVINYSNQKLVMSDEYSQVASWYRWQQNLKPGLIWQSIFQPHILKREVLYYERQQ